MVILIVDDSSTIRKMYINVITRMFQDSAEIHQAANGQEGLDKLNELRCVDLVLLDVNMPVMKGDELLKIIRSNPAFNNTMVILSTTEGSSDFVKQMIKDGADSYIRKPFNATKAENAIKIAYRKMNRVCK